ERFLLVAIGFGHQLGIHVDVEVARNGITNIAVLRESDRIATCLANTHLSRPYGPRRNLGAPHLDALGIVDEECRAVGIASRENDVVLDHGHTLTSRNREKAAANELGVLETRDMNRDANVTLEAPNGLRIGRLGPKRT